MPRSLPFRWRGAKGKKEEREELRFNCGELRRRSINVENWKIGGWCWSFNWMMKWFLKFVWMYMMHYIFVCHTRILYVVFFIRECFICIIYNIWYIIYNIWYYLYFLYFFAGLANVKIKKYIKSKYKLYIVCIFLYIFQYFCSFCWSGFKKRVKGKYKMGKYKTGKYIIFLILDLSKLMKKW